MYKRRNWRNYLTQSISFRSDYDGKDRRTIVTSKDLLEPNGLAVSGEYLYFIDSKRKSLDRVDKVSVVVWRKFMMGSKALLNGPMSFHEPGCAKMSERMRY